jgi:hypothetical protein
MRLNEFEQTRLEPPRIQKLDSRGRITIYLINTEWVRKNEDPDFKHAGEGNQWDFIPENEIWIGKEIPENQRQFVIERLLVEHRLMGRGIKYQFAVDISKYAIDALRHKISGGGLTDKFGGNPLKAHIRKWLDTGQPFGKATESPLSVWIVDGKLIRELFDNKFFEAGNGLTNPYIPKNEIWIDADVVAPDRPFVLLHQLYEHYFRSKGEDVLQSYIKANRIESEVRQVPDKNLFKQLARFGIASKDIGDDYFLA